MSSQPTLAAGQLHDKFARFRNRRNGWSETLGQRISLEVGLEGFGQTGVDVFSSRADLAHHPAEVLDIRRALENPEDTLVKDW